MTNESSEDFSINDYRILIFDMSFYFLGIIAFYNSVIIAIISIFIIGMIFYRTQRYKIDNRELYLNSFIDFLNQINSGLSSGVSITESIKRSANDNLGDCSYMGRVILMLENAISLGINGDELLNEIKKHYPIVESHNYVKMSKIASKTGASMEDITEITLDNLYTRFKAISEAHLIIYQKHIERMILCIAPIFVIFFVQYSSKQYLDIMYNSWMGIGVMTFSFAILIIMKIVGNYIVRSISKIKKRNELMSSVELAISVSTLSASIKSGSTLERAISDTFGERFLIEGLSSIESINMITKKSMDKSFFRLIRMLNQYHKNGSPSTLLALNKFHDELWIEHTGEIKKKSEQSSIKLTLLLSLSLISIIAVIVTPVMMMFK